jgi:hypothetical protein
MIFLLRKSIEVEGFEHAVLKGAQKVLETHPCIFVEVTKHHDEIGELLRDADHKLRQQRIPLDDFNSAISRHLGHFAIFLTEARGAVYRRTCRFVALRRKRKYVRRSFRIINSDSLPTRSDTYVGKI